MNDDLAIEMCRQLTDDILHSGDSMNEMAGRLAMCSAHFLGGSAAMFGHIAKVKGEKFTQEEMVRSTANVIVDMTYGAKQ